MELIERGVDFGISYEVKVTIYESVPKSVTEITMAMNERPFEDIKKVSKRIEEIKDKLEGIALEVISGY